MQRDLLTFALVKLLAFAPLFNAPKKHVLKTVLCLKWKQFVAKRCTAENRKRVVEERGFFLIARRTHYLQIIQINYYLSNYFNLLQEIKDGLEPSTRSHTIPALSKLL